MWEVVHFEMQIRRTFGEKYNISKFDYSPVIILLREGYGTSLRKDYEV
jgi:hypothetical protein